MRGLRKKADKPGDSALRILFTTDLHGSESAFRKFVNAAVEFKADIALLGGDLTGKSLVPVLQSNGGHTAEFMGRQLKADTRGELAELERTIRLAGQYPFRTTQEETDRLREHPGDVDRVFVDAMRVSLEGWFDLAAERLGPKGIRLLAIAGNDDPREIDDVLREHEFVQHVDRDVFEIEPGVEVVGFSGANRTPWHSPREYDEPEIRTIIEERIARLAAPEKSIWNIHVPPRNSGLDTCPVVRPDLTVVNDGGEPRLHGAGSSAVRELIDQYQPMLSVHGHIHESRAISKLGGTVAVNPGSEYTEGILRAAFIRIDPHRGVRAQLLSA
jgi:Icc-related predicted phosphoesterase